MHHQGDNQPIRIMPPNWKPHEIAIACKAYASATQNGIHGADQDLENFNADIIEKIRLLAPAGYLPDTYHERGRRIYPYLRDNVFGEIQKFNKALRIVNSSHPSGVTNKQMVSMAIAIHLKITNKMDYKNKDYDKEKWRLYGSWVILKDLPKFCYDLKKENNENSVNEVSKENEKENKNDAIVGMMVLSGNETSVSSTSTHVGRDKAKAIAKQENLKQKFEVFNENIKIGKSIVDKLSSLENILQKKTKVNIWKTVAAATTDPIKKEELLKKIIDLTDTF